MSDLVASRRLPDGLVFAVVQLFISLPLVCVAANAVIVTDDGALPFVGLLALTQLLPLGISAAGLPNWTRARALAIASVAFTMLTTSIELLSAGRYAMTIIFIGWWISVLARLSALNSALHLTVVQAQPTADATTPSPGVRDGVPPQIWAIIAIEVFLLFGSGFLFLVVYHAIAHNLAGMDGADFLVALAISSVPFLFADLAALVAAASMPFTRRWGRAFLLSATWLRVAFMLTALSGVVSAAHTRDANDGDSRVGVAVGIVAVPLLLLAGEVWLILSRRVSSYVIQES